MLRPSKIALAAVCLLLSQVVYSQVEILFSVDITQYAQSNSISANGIRIGGNFETHSATYQNSAVPNWVPSSSQCGMYNNSGMIWTIAYTFPETSIGDTLLFKFVNGDWGTNEGLSGNNLSSSCALNDGFGNINRFIVIPACSQEYRWCWDECSQCNQGSPLISTYDPFPPVAHAKNLTVYLDSSGNVIINGAMADSMSYDACGIGLFTLSKDTFGCADVGTNTVGFNAFDLYGNQSSDTFQVTVLDTLTPMILTHDAVVYLDSFGNGFLDIQDVDSGSFDNCSFTMHLSDSVFSCEHQGSNTITLTAVDMSGNTASATVTIIVLDTIYSINTIGGLGALSQGTQSIYYTNSLPNATYEWSVVNGVILNSNSDSCEILWSDSAQFGQVNLLQTSEFGCVDSIHLEVELWPTGIAEVKTNGLAIYPNPTSNELFIEFSGSLESATQCNIYSSSGQLVKTALLRENEYLHQLKTNDLNPGVYFLNILGNNLQINEVLIIK